MGWRFFTAGGAERKTAASVANPQATIYNSVAQAIPTTTQTVLGFNTVLADTDGMTSTANKITIKHAGRYLIEVAAEIAANATGSRQLFARINAAATGSAEQVAAAPSGSTMLTCAAVVDLNVGDVIDAIVQQTSGGSLNVSAASAANLFACSLKVTKIDGAVVNYVGVPGSLIGQELAYAEFTTGPLNITQTLQANAQLVVATPTLTFDGSTPVIVEAWGNVNTPSLAASYIVPEIWLDTGTSYGFNTILTPAAGQMQVPFTIRRRVTPPAGTHTFGLRAWASSTTGGPQVLGGGGGAAPGPAAIRVTRAA